MSKKAFLFYKWCDEFLNFLVWYTNIGIKLLGYRGLIKQLKTYKFRIYIRDEQKYFLSKLLSVFVLVTNLY